MNILKHAFLLSLLCGMGKAVGFVGFFAPAPFFPEPAYRVYEEVYDEYDDEYEEYCYRAPVRRVHRVCHYAPPMPIFAPRPYVGFGFCAPAPMFGFGVSVNLRG